MTAIKSDDLLSILGGLVSVMQETMENEDTQREMGPPPEVPEDHAPSFFKGLNYGFDMVIDLVTGLQDLEVLTAESLHAMIDRLAGITDDDAG